MGRENFIRTLESHVPVVYASCYTEIRVKHTSPFRFSELEFILVVHEFLLSFSLVAHGPMSGFRAMGFLQHSDDVML